MSLDRRPFWEIQGAMPLKLKSHTLEVRESELSVQAGRPTRGADELIWKLDAERQRLTRLLPEAPLGCHWEFETQRSDDVSRDLIIFRIVAILKEEPQWP